MKTNKIMKWIDAHPIVVGVILGILGLVLVAKIMDDWRHRR